MKKHIFSLTNTYLFAFTYNGSLPLSLRAEDPNSIRDTAVTFQFMYGHHCINHTVKKEDIVAVANNKNGTIEVSCYGGKIDVLNQKKFNEFVESGAITPKTNRPIYNPEKGLELKKILLERLAVGDETPIKKIKCLSGNKKVYVEFLGFIPMGFNGTGSSGFLFSGRASEHSSKLELFTNEKGSALAKNNPVDFQATVYIENVVDFEL